MNWPTSSRSRWRWYAAVFVGGALVVSAVAAVNSTTGHRAPSGAKSTTVVASLPVVRCPTEVGVSHGSRVHLAKVIKERVNRDLGTKVALYADQYDIMRAIGPRGWSCVASIAADGGAQLSIYTPGTKAPVFFGSLLGRSLATEVTVQQEPACEGCRLAMACPFFTSARRLFQKSFPGAGSLTICVRPSGEVITKSTNDLRYFKDAPGAVGHAYPSGGPDRAFGVAFYDPDTYSYLVSCTLSKSLNELCRGVLAWFVRHHQAI